MSSQYKKFLNQELEKKLISYFIENGFERTKLSKNDQSSVEMKKAFGLGRLKRIKNDIVEVIEIQFDQYNNLVFVINFGKYPAHMEDETDIFNYQKDNSSFLRLYSNSSKKWFKLGFLSKTNDINLSKLVNKAVLLSSEIIFWFDTSKLGKHTKKTYGFIKL